MSTRHRTIQTFHFRRCHHHRFTSAKFQSHFHLSQQSTNMPLLSINVKTENAHTHTARPTQLLCRSVSWLAEFIQATYSFLRFFSLSFLWMKTVVMSAIELINKNGKIHQLSHRSIRWRAPHTQQYLRLGKTPTWNVVLSRHYTFTSTRAHKHSPHSVVWVHAPNIDFCPARFFERAMHEYDVARPA